MFWLGAAVSLCYIPGYTGAYIATQWSVLAVLLSFDILWTYAVTQRPGLAALLPFYGVRKGPFTILHAFGLIFLAYAAACVPTSLAPYASVFGLWLVVIMGLCLWFGTTVTNVRGLYAGLATGAAVSSAVAVFQYFGFTGVPTTTGTPAGIYVNGVQQGAVLALIAVALASERMWVWMLPLVPGIVLAQSRGAWIALAVGLLGCGFRRLWVLSVIGVVGVFYLINPLSSSDAQRLLFWHFAWDNLTWLGWGPGMFYTIVLPQNGVFSLYPEYAHNDALQLAFEYGIFALLPITIAGYALSRTDVKEWPVVLAFVAAGCYSMPLFMPIAAFLALVAMGRILRSYDVAGDYSGHSGQYVVPGQRETGLRAVPVASHHSAKG